MDIDMRPVLRADLDGDLRAGVLISTEK
jgi:hypothetical protein